MANLPGTPYAAYSTRKIVAAYAGNAVQVARKSDGTTLNVGFSGTDFDVASYNTFVAGTVGFVTRWYDQSGNTRDLTPSTLSPVGINTPQLIVLNGKAYLCFLVQDAVTSLGKILSAAINFPTSGNLTIGVGGVSLVNDNQSIVFSNLGGSAGPFLDFSGTGSGGVGSNPGNVFYFDAVSRGPNAGVNMLSGQHNTGITVNGGSLVFYHDGAPGTQVGGISQSNASGANPTGIGGYPGNSFAFAYNGVLTEWYFYNSALTAAQMLAISQDEAAYWPDPGFGFPYVVGDTNAGVTFGINTVLTSGSGERVDLGTALNYEYTQPWTMFAAVQLVGVPTSSGTPAAIIFTNVQAASPFTGYEVWINGNGALVVRLIHAATSAWIDMHQTTPTICDLNQHMVVVSYNGNGLASGVHVYVDGTEVAMSVDANTLGGQTIIGAGQLFWLGMQQNLFFPLGGVLKRFQMDNVARSSTYIAACATPSALPPVDANTQVLLRFQAGTGTNAADSSGNNRNGTLTNAGQWMLNSPNAPAPVQPGGGAQPVPPSGRPISITNLLSGEVIGFDTTSDVLLGNPFFT